MARVSVYKEVKHVDLSFLESWKKGESRMRDLDFKLLSISPICVFKKRDSFVVKGEKYM